MTPTITIIGGGLAGLTLGIGLRQQAIPVVVHEQGCYPRHRVCGEFISGNGQETLRRLGLLELLVEAGARRAHTAAFFSYGKGFPIHPMPQPALCLSRFTLDALLADKFKELGGDLHCGTRGPQAESSEGTVQASGRRAQADGDTDGWRWFGVKAHARNLTLTADLELHVTANGYVGLCRLQEGKTNICGLFRRRKGDADWAHGVVERLQGERGSILFRRLESAEFEDDSLCAVGGLSLRPSRAASLPQCCIGDALTMIPPVTGNGMSMAFESAELAVRPLASYARREIPWGTARRAVAEKCDRAFEDRLRWARCIQRMLLWPSGRACFLPMALKWEASWRFLFWATR